MTIETWQYQGRQEHGWFGHGTAPGGSADGDDLFRPENFDARIDSVAYTLVAHLPRGLPGNSAATFDAPARERLRRVMTAWEGAAGMDDAGFADRYLDDRAGQKSTALLRQAARQIAAARSHADLREAGAKLAAAMRQIGLGNWPRFLAVADVKASEAGATASYQVAQNMTPDRAADGIPGSNPAMTPAERINAAGRMAYEAFRYDCSHSMHEFLRLMGVNEPYRVANDMIEHMSHSPDYEEVAREQAEELARQGKIVIAGKAEPGGHGHVLALGSGPAQHGGGFAGLPLTPGLYPQSFGGGSGSWEGVRSDGRRTVYDAFKPTELKYVKY